MKILGIGVDIVENSRIGKLLKNKIFIKRIFSYSEILIANKIKDKKSYYSKRFAAKEAFVKSIGTGFRDDFNFKDLSIVNDKFGKPSFIINEKIKKLLKNNLKQLPLISFYQFQMKKNILLLTLFYKKNENK